MISGITATGAYFSSEQNLGLEFKGVMTSSVPCLQHFTLEYTVDHVACVDFVGHQTHRQSAGVFPWCCRRSGHLFTKQKPPARLFGRKERSSREEQSTELVADGAKEPVPTTVHRRGYGKPLALTSSIIFNGHCAFARPARYVASHLQHGQGVAVGVVFRA